MSYRNTLEAALESLHDIENLIKGFPQDGDIPAIEIDLSLQKLRNLYELLLMLPKQVINPPAPDVMPAGMEPEKAKITEVQTEIEIREVKVTAETPVAPPQPAEIKGRRTQILSDRFKGRSTLHESLHQSIGSDRSLISQSRPIGNLMSAIGINDRFTFIRELFNNDPGTFENAITVLNESASLDDAYDYIIRNYQWDMESDAVQLLLEIIRRKYAGRA